MSAGEGDADPSLLPPSAPIRCWFCGEPEVVELAEVWGHQFMWETCCQALHESLCQQVADDPAWGRELLRRLGTEAFAGHRLRRVADDDSGGLVLDWQLRVRPVAFAAARAFVGRYHAHCAPLVTWRYGHAALNGPTLVGVAMTGNPVARAYVGRGIVEVGCASDATCRVRLLGTAPRCCMVLRPGKPSGVASGALSPIRGLTRAA